MKPVQAAVAMLSCGVSRGFTVSLAGESETQRVLTGTAGTTLKRPSRPGCSAPQEME